MKYSKWLLYGATKTVVDALKPAFKKVVHKAAEETGEFLGKKTLAKLWNEKLQLMGIHEMMKK